ncbi:MAG: thioredoxin-like domain-containing protein [Chitinophagaceae bacterium]
MKYHSFLLLCIFAFAITTLGQSRFVLKGKIQADFPQIIQIEYLDKIDSSISNNGDFQFTGSLDHPALVRLSSKNALNNQVVTKEILVEKGNIEIETDFNRLRWANPSMQFGSSQRVLDDYNNKFSLLVDMYRFTRDSLLNKSEIDTILKRKVNKLSSKINHFEELYEKDFILQNSNNYVGAYFFFRYGTSFMEEDEIDSVYALFPEEIKSSFYLRKVAEKQKYSKLLKEGIQIPQIRLHNTSQKEVLLNSLFTKKITLIDIWASWCIPCIQTHAVLKQLHTKYGKTGLNIIGISLDSKTDNWLKHLKNSPLPWSNFIDPKGESGIINNIFNLVSGNGIPFFALINDKGEYVKIGIEVDELETYIDSYLR